MPTTAEVKVERAMELFNDSDHQRTIAGLRRSLGDPWISALPDEEPSERRVRRRGLGAVLVSLPGGPGRRVDPVMMLDKGEEIEQIDEYLREWNAALDPSGRVLAGHTASDGGTEG